MAVSYDDEIAMTVTSRMAVQLFKSDMVTTLSFTKKENRERDFDPPTSITFDENSILVTDSINSSIHTFSRKLQSKEDEYKGRKFGEKGDSWRLIVFLRSFPGQKHLFLMKNFDNFYR